MDIALNLAKLFTRVARQENDTLSQIPDMGIFQMPELAFAYECGKAAMLESQSIFGSKQPTWEREIDLGNGGPTDLVFEFGDGKKIAVEFKLRDISTSYKKDISKLGKLSGSDESTVKIFCALIDVFDHQLPDEGRQKEVETSSGQPIKILSKEAFSTETSWYKSPISCVVCVWLVGDDDIQHGGVA